MVRPSTHNKAALAQTDGDEERRTSAMVQSILERSPTLPTVAIVFVLVLFVWRTLRSLEQTAGDSHIGSWVALAAGLALTATSYLLARSVHQHALTRHRLDETRRDAVVDELTGLMNRKGITVDIERRLAERGPSDLVGVLFCDLDRLKVVNDSLGHAAGDEVLRVAASRLSTLVRETDSIGRFGGDEFVIISSGLPTIRDLEILAGRLTDALRKPTVLSDSSAQVISGSIGIAWLSGESDDAPDVIAGELLRDADVAMYQAKQEGGGRFAMFDSSLRAHAVTRLELEQELRRGMREGQLEVHYQPIVDLGPGAVNRFEALIRWNHPDRGMVHPAEFLSVAAESLLIVELGETVLMEACRQAVVWSAHTGRAISVAVNIAERQLLDLTLVDTVTRVLATTGLPPAQLELEITEELIMERIDRSLIVLRQLDLLGVCLAIDDFGTSQASLSQLKKLAMVSTLKIDRLFVEGIASDEVDRKIVAAIVALANSVGMTVVAEGVETSAQARILGELGVDYLQGFLFARPGSAAKMDELLGPGEVAVSL
ncbi:MAG: putative bifunctional diguanylate cyclase/phosphodiesterase [Acidimicrobiales bacterium]